MGDERRRAATAVFGLTAVCVAMAAGCGQAPPPAPVERIFLVTIDTLRADHLASYGYPRVTSPFLDALAEEGVLFERAVSSASTTAPSHASIFTSLHPFQHGLSRNGQPLDPALPTLAGVLRERGFETAAFVSVGFLRTVAAGFEHFDGPDDPSPEGERYRPAAQTLERAVRWLGAPGRRERSFVWLHLFDVHEHHRPPPLDAARLAELRDAPLGDLPLRRFLIEHRGVDPRHLDSQAVEELHRYDLLIELVDTELRRFYESAGGPRSLWVVTSDHGEGLWSQGYRGHRAQVYQAQVHVPLILHFGDGRHAARRVPDLVQLVDLSPTLLAALEVPEAQWPPARQGRSLLPLLRGEQGGGARPALSQPNPKPGRHGAALHALQDDRFKLIDRGGQGDELYDLRSDPFELDDLAGRSPQQERLAGTLREMLGGPAARSSRSARPVDATWIEELEALGYLDAPEPPGPEGAPPTSRAD